MYKLLGMPLCRHSESRLVKSQALSTKHTKECTFAPGSEIVWAGLPRLIVPAEQGAPLDPSVRYATAEDARKARAQTERVLWHNTGSPHGRTKQTVRKSTGTAHATRVLYNMNENSGPYGWAVW